jgi:hypothetical protein
MYSCFHPVNVADSAPAFDEESIDLDDVGDVEPLYIEDMDKHYPDEWIKAKMASGIAKCIADWRYNVNVFSPSLVYTFPWIVTKPRSLL